MFEVFFDIRNDWGQMVQRRLRRFRKFSAARRAAEKLPGGYVTKGMRIIYIPKREG